MAQIYGLIPEGEPITTYIQWGSHPLRTEENNWDEQDFVASEKLREYVVTCGDARALLNVQANASHEVRLQTAAANVHACQ